jgi:hypothetical protein
MTSDMTSDVTGPAAQPLEPGTWLLDKIDARDRPLRARDLCQALDLPIVSKNTENIRAKLKRLVSRGVLIETEPGLFTQPRP